MKIDLVRAVGCARVAFGVGVLLATGFATAATITVDTAVDEAMTANGNCTLREAIQAANNDAAEDGCAAGSGADEIAFDGNYTITLSQGEISVISDITLNFTTPTTVTLDGNGTNRAFTMASSSSQLALHNLRIQNCVESGGSGGAILINNASAALSATNVTFDSNQATAASANGGAIESSGDLTLTDVTFTNNSAGNDGGAVNLSGSTLTATNCLFGTPPLLGSGNSAGNNGGAMAYTTSATLDAVTLTNVVFFDNSAAGGDAQDGGGALWVSCPNDILFLFSVTNCEFLNNVASNGAGGAILTTLDSRIAYADPLLPFVGGINRSHFQLNRAQGPNTVDGAGGAIYSRGPMTLVACSFYMNSSDASAGGAIAHNPGSDRALTIANTTFSQNTADTDGGAIASLHASSGTVSLINCTIADNTATVTTGSGGGGIYNNNADAGEFTLRNTIVSGNTSNGAPGNCAGDPLTDNGNNLQWAPTTGCGTLTAGDPLLDAAAPDLIAPNTLVWVMALNDLSAAAGTGDEPTCDAGPIISLDGRGMPRPDNHPSCDIGAYESSAVPVELQSFTAE